MNKGIAPIAIILIIIGVLALGGGVWYWQQQQEIKKLQKQAEELSQIKPPPPQPIQQQNNATTTIGETANWKTYRNEEYGFEIKYPSYFVNLETKKLDKHPGYGGNYYFSAMISQPEPSSGWKYRRYFQVEVTDGIPSKPASDLESSDVLVGTESYKIYWSKIDEDVAGANAGHIFVNKNHRWFIFNIKYESDNTADHNKLSNDFIQILSAFKFIK